jgi:CRISPR-associated protein Cas2
LARRRYLVAYDIREDRRLRNVATCMEGYGERIQYSVFVCDLSDQEAVLMRGDVEARMKRDDHRSWPGWRLVAVPVPGPP